MERVIINLEQITSLSMVIPMHEEAKHSGSPAVFSVTGRAHYFDNASQLTCDMHCSLPGNYTDFGRCNKFRGAKTDVQNESQSFLGHHSYSC